MASPGVLYLDVDDEITSAAARIRRTEATRVALVLPYGSRVATSRINFRLLARDALLHEKRLSIVAPDGATRALAASAGLPVFATVAEYDSSLVEEDRAAVGSVSAPPASADDSPTMVVPVAGAAAGAAGPAGAAAQSDVQAVTTAPAPRPLREPTGTPTPRPVTATPPARRPAEPEPLRARSIPVFGGGRAALPRVPVLVAAAVLGLVLLVGGVGAWLLLPSATIVVTPHERLVGPQTLSIIADTTATEPDAEAGVVPAERITLPVTASGTFESTGVRTEETRAEGRVTFTSYDTRGPNRIPAGSVIATEGGIRFRTLRDVTLPRADIVPPTSVSPTTASVAVEAVRVGPDANVPANAISLVPANEDPVITKVRNGEPTSGGSRTEFPIVAQADIDAALAALNEQLQATFREQLDDPTVAPPGAVVFPETALLGTVTPTTDPATLLDAEQETFELAVEAEGTVIAVNPDPVQQIAQTRLESLVAPGNVLVDGSVRIEPGTPVVEGQEISFPVAVRAAQVAIPDAAELKSLVMGRTADEAEELLAEYGEVEVTLWPDWVSSVPTMDGRVTVEVGTPIPAEEPDPTAAPSLEPEPTLEPSGSPSPASSAPSASP